MPLITRAAKGSKLTHAEVDGNWAYLDERTRPTMTSKYSVVGPLSVIPGVSRWYPDREVLITGMYFSVGTASTSPVSVAARLNGGSALGGTPLALAPGGHKSATRSLNTVMTPDDYLTLDVNASGGADMVVTFTYK